MNRFSRFLPILAAPAGLLLALGGCGGGYGDDGGGSPAGQITSIDITPVEATITTDGTQQFTAAASNASGSSVSAGSLDWRSSNAGVATIDNNGLATAVAAGTTTITARKDTSTQYEGGGVVVSNDAELIVTASSGVTGIAAGPKPMANALIVMRDQAGNSQTVMTDAAGRFGVSVAGMVPPFMLRVVDPSGYSLFSAGVEPGVININPVTDLLVRAWHRANGLDADAAFSGQQAESALDASALESLDGAVERAFGDTLSGQGLAVDDFSFFSTPYAADGAGLDRVLAGFRVEVTASRMTIHDRLSDSSAEVTSTPDGRAVLRVQSSSGQDAVVPLLP